MAEDEREIVLIINMKYIFLLSLIALVILLPGLLIFAILIYIKLGSPVFFKQQRPGKNGEIFEPTRIIQALQDFISTNAADTQKTEKRYGDGVVAKYKGNYVTLKLDNRKISPDLMSKIEALLQSELEKTESVK